MPSRWLKKPKRRWKASHAAWNDCKKKQKNRDERRELKQKRKAESEAYKATSSDEPEVPAVKEEPSPDEEKPVKETFVDENREAAPSRSQEQKDEKMEEDPASSLVKEDDKNEKIEDEPLSPTSVPCF